MTMSRIKYEPAECSKDCNIPDCHYSHGDTWFVFGIPYFTRAAAEAALTEKDAREKQTTLKTGDELTRRMLKRKLGSRR